MSDQQAAHDMFVSKCLSTNSEYKAKSDEMQSAVNGNLSLLGMIVKAFLSFLHDTSLTTLPGKILHLQIHWRWTMKLRSISIQCLACVWNSLNVHGRSTVKAS